MKSKKEKKKERGGRKEENMRKKWFNTLLVFISCWLQYKEFFGRKKMLYGSGLFAILTARLVWQNDHRKKIESCK